MNLKIPQSAALLGIAIAVSSATLPGFGQTAHSIPPPPVAGPQSPFAGSVVEDIVVRVNDQIISKSDYDRQMEELETTGRQQNWTQQQLDDQKKNLLRDMVDQQLLLSKGKELGITGETEMVKQLDAIRKQNNLDSMEALEAAAKQQGVSFEDFKQHIRDRIVTQQVIGQEVYRKVNISQSDLQKYYDAHKAEFDKPESVRLSEILVPTTSDDPAHVAAAQATAQDVYAKLQGGAKFEDLAKSSSAGTTAAQGGDLGEFKRGQLAKVLEDQTFSLKPGEYTQPIHTKQGFVILEVVTHTPGGLQPLKDVLPQVEEAVGAERTEPALRAYLKQLRQEAYIDYKPGYVDTSAIVNPSKPNYSAYTAPTPKKKKKIERTRYRQRVHGSAPATQQATTAAPAAPVAPNVPSLAQVPGAATAAGNPSAPAAAEPTTGQVGATGASTEDQVGVANPPVASGPAPNDASTSASSPSQSPSSSAKASNTQVASAATQKPGKKEKIRFGQAPTKTLPAATPTQTVDAGADGSSANTDTAARNGMTPEMQVAANNAGDAPAAGTPTEAEKKSRFSDRAKLPKEKKSKEPKVDPFAPPSVSAEEVADRQTQSAPLGLSGDTTKTKKVKPTEKTRLQDQVKNKNAAATDDTNAPGGAPAEPAAQPPTPPSTPEPSSQPGPPATQPQQ
ncbi:Survival protein SurA precursor (Peptidyl-prolyl cis-trans isomerase SurA) [Acidisarcina polymorpha]|uniref:peptidylprolyl isomerase n=1 Tax=Acidisarcina polymorpha TaxID=2211140 RepID=A0A2Z5FXB2_9BACT|nr:peptidylprolyl isomerase [Acidisarcina polymorpha]AXC11491.1 Survival protein SurA precursor (Peptidyl-prolyl cis-trans isomerase SurA) [Acidisarcina polymorpha]